METQIADGLWTVEGPEVVFAGAAMHTRMTVVQLGDGTLWVHSPIALDMMVVAFVERLGGNVSALVAPNKFHHLFMGEWRAAYPEARVFAEADLKRKVPTLADVENITDEPPPLYAAEIDQVVFVGNRLFQEAVFFHRPSRSLILTDLMINLKTQGMGLLPKLFLQFEGVTWPDGGVPRLYRWLTRDKDAARQALAKVMGWAPERVLFCHGEAIEGSARDLLEREFAYLL